MCIIFFMFIGSKVQDNLLFALMGMATLFKVQAVEVYTNTLSPPVSSRIKFCVFRQ